MLIPSAYEVDGDLLGVGVVDRYDGQFGAGVDGICIPCRKDRVCRAGCHELKQVLIFLSSSAVKRRSQLHP